MQEIAIIGMACRFPGAPNLKSFWELLAEGRSAMCEPPADRWPLDAVYSPVPKTPGRSYSRQAGFLKDIRTFDARFFGISDKEASAMDPQQRLLLEQCWHALEDANVDPKNISATATGVFVGAMSNEYLRQSLGESEKITAFTGVGNGLSMLANRISYALNLRGISLTVDTACSSSLVALHTACLHLDHGDIDLAIVAGVNLMLDPAMDIFYSQVGLISPTGQCRTFSASADGIARGEGVGVVVLQRAKEVPARHAPLVYAHVAGCAVNHGGRSNGITAPNLAMQTEVIRRAHRRAGIAPEQIDYVELHGTGTLLGDPIEAQALGTALREDPATPRVRPCLVGSVKSNIGHLEGAAGIAGVIKAALALKREQIPASLHCDAVNPLLRLQATGMELVRELTDWPRNGARRHAGISSFGLGGTNAHVVLKSPTQHEPVAALPPDAAPNLFMLPLSARSPAALSSLAYLHLDALPVGDLQRLAAHCATVADGRSCFEYRLLATGSDADSLASNLHQQAALRPSMRPAFRRHNMPLVVFAFSGQGSQWAGMGRALCRRFPVFDDAISECAALFKPLLGESLRTLVLTNDDSTRVDDTAIAQPLIFSYQFAMTRWLASFGIHPGAVVGHSIGEYAAAVASGVMDLPIAVELVAARGRLMRDHGLRGGMTTLLANVEMVDELIRELAGETLFIAGYNSDQHITVAGTCEAVERISDLARAKGVRVTPLRVTRAFHTPMPKQPLAAFGELIATKRLQPPQLPFVSTLTGTVEREALTGADYWRRQITEPVRFVDAVHAVCKSMKPLWLEIGSRPTLSALLADIKAANDSVVAATSHRRLPEDEAALGALKDLYVAGINIDWSGHLAGVQTRCRVPVYPFEGVPYWHDMEMRWPATQLGLTTLPGIEQKSKAVSGAGEPPTVAVADYQAVLRQAVARVAGTDAASIKTHQTLMDDLGFNSLMFAELKLDLQQRLPALKTMSFRDLSLVVTIDDLEAVVERHLAEQNPPQLEKLAT